MQTQTLAIQPNKVITQKLTTKTSGLNEKHTKKK